MKNHLIGKIVMQRNNIGTIIGYRKDVYSEYITIEWDTRDGEDKQKTYQFPKIFLTKDDFETKEECSGGALWRRLITIGYRQ